MEEVLYRDIETVADIEEMVYRFYETVRKDELIGGIFNGVLNGKWDEHLEKMVRFWQTILLNEKTYSGAPFPPHAMLPVREMHFDRWKELFIAQLDARFRGPIAEEAKSRARLMAGIFLAKVQHIQGFSQEGKEQNYKQS